MTGELIKHTHLFLTVLEAGSSRSDVSMGRSGGGPLLGCRLLTSHGILTWQRAERKLALLTLIRAPIPFMRAPPSQPHLTLTSQRPHVPIAAH